VSPEETQQKIKYLKCTRELILVRFFIVGNEDFDVIDLRFINENTFWVLAEKFMNILFGITVFQKR